MKDISELVEKSFRILFYDEVFEYNYTITQLKKALELNKNSHAFNNLAVAYFEIGELDKALDNINSAIEINPANDIAYMNRAELSEKLKNSKQAESDYSEAIKLNVNEDTYWRCRAYFFKDNNKLSESLADFKQANRIDPGFKQTKIEIKELEKNWE